MRTVAAIALVFVTVGSAPAQKKKLPLPGEVFTVAGRTAFVIEPPKSARRPGPTPWVWYAPTLPRLPGRAEKWMFERFLAKGIAIAGIDVGESYGSPKGRADYQKLYEHLTSTRGYGKKPVLLARSRGGLMLYSWAVEHPESVGGVAGIYPVCNIASYPGLSRAAPAFGMNAEELGKSLAAHNPIDRLAPLAKAKVPILHIHGDEDRVVPLSVNSAVLAKRYRELGGPAEVIVQKGRGHDMWRGWFESQRLTKFVIDRALDVKKRRSALPGITLHVREGHVDVESTVCLRRGTLELIACTKGSKEHESIVAIEATARHVHTALLLLGAEPGAPARQDIADVPPRGTPIDVSLVVADKTGQQVERPIRDFVRPVEGTRRFPTNTFLFAGSRLADLGAGPRTYVADVTGNAISIVTFGDETLGLSGIHDPANASLMWEVDPTHLPKPGTKVILRLRPKRAAAKKPARQPNVVFVLADDLGYGDLGCYGAKHFATPSCDRLAKEGMRFTDAHSPSAVCTPTRYSVLTGRYAWRTWLKNWVLFAEHPLLIDTDRLTMGKLFQGKGYATGCVGKWHLGWGTDLRPDFSGATKPGPLEVGFDSFFGVPFSHNSPKPLQVFVRDRRIVNLEPGLSYKSPEAMKKTVRKLQDTAIELSKEAVAFVAKNKDRPFFLYYPTTNIHFPLTPNRRFKGKTKAGVYGEFVVEFDWAVGELLAALDRHGLTENTIVVVTSDNGARPHKSLNGHACNGAWRGTKRQIYEGGHRIPLLVRWPGKVKAGSVSDETVCLTDFFATFASTLGQELPSDAGEDSYDLRPVLLGRKYRKPLREATVHHSVSGRFAIRKGPWKLIEGRDDGDYPRNAKGRIDTKRRMPQRDPKTKRFVELDYFDLPPPKGYQLFHLGRDRGERRDVSGDHPTKVRELRALLDRYRASGRSTKTGRN